jgi:hypothetical protein
MIYRYKKTSLEDIKNNEELRDLLDKDADDIRSEFQQVCEEKGVPAETLLIAMLNNFLLFVNNGVTEFTSKGGE